MSKTSAILAGLAGAIILGNLPVLLADDLEAPPTVPFTQSEFPCQEDEVLGYAPEFGPDHVGCIHIDALKG